MMTTDSQRLPEARLLVAGEWVTGAATTDVLDKFRLVPCARVHTASAQQVQQAVCSADEAFRTQRLTPHDTGAVLDRAAQLLEQRAEQVIATLQLEGGFTHSDASGEHRRTVQTIRLSAEEARRVAGDVLPMEGAPQQAGRLGFTMRVPLGVVCAITPFNAPLNTVTHKIAPAIAAGNTVVLKPSPRTPMTANLLAEILLAAGLPPQRLQVLHGGVDVVNALLEEQRVRFIAFTGSTEAGRAIQARAGLRRTQMELGSIAFTALADDANLDVALPKVINAAYRKAGQVCTSIQVLLVHEKIRATVEDRLAGMVQSLPYGDPQDRNNVVGPVISEESARRIEGWIDQAVAQGAQRLAGGERKGAVVPPTLLTNVSPTMNVACSEVFGPVLCIVPYGSLDELVEKVNATPYGLATGIFTNRLGDALALARRLEVGSVHINETSSSRVDMMPYGGSKDSGFGREGPHHAVLEMTEERVVTFTTA